MLRTRFWPITASPIRPMSQFASGITLLLPVDQFAKIISLDPVPRAMSRVQPQHPYPNARAERDARVQPALRNRRALAPLLPRQTHSSGPAPPDAARHHE